ncbi:hypothetical protein RvY_05173-1 [Ramazzottius varieornatus]|uniref:Uncharacterized protein n=1 Tax=Ramazzottius varieornatus TaxID=947166 RepID=A0A1D1UU82_RAMVA|nr:hypothetical protein RvY_05173-1 [Ramazzottius varieornatus]
MFCRRVYSDAVQVEPSWLLQNLQKFSFLLSPASGGIDVEELIYGHHTYDCKDEVASLWKPVCWHWHILTHWSPDRSWWRRLLAFLWAYRYFLMGLLFVFLLVWWRAKKAKEWWNAGHLARDSSASLEDDESYHLLVNESTELGNKEFTNPVEHKGSRRTIPGLSRSHELEPLEDEPVPKKSRIHH